MVSLWSLGDVVVPILEFFHHFVMVYFVLHQNILMLIFLPFCTKCGMQICELQKSLIARVMHKTSLPLLIWTIYRQKFNK